MTGYGIKEVSNLVGLAPARIRSFIRSGLLTSQQHHSKYQRYRFAFQDIVLLKMAKELDQAGLSSRKICRTLGNLQQRLPLGKSLSSVRVVVEGGAVLVRDRDTAWDPRSGQLSLGLESRPTTVEVAPMLKQALDSARKDPEASADDWYNLGVDLELTEAWNEAVNAYRSALKIDPNHWDAGVNLGRLSHLLGDLERAETYYRAVLGQQEDHATAWFNFGVLMDEQNRTVDAIEAYRCAIAADPHFADAHYNLSRLMEKQGDKKAALRHLSEYRALL